MKKEWLQSVRQALANVWPLYGAAFTMAINLSILWTAMPFIIRNMGGAEEHVGYVWAANMFGYMLCLLLFTTGWGHLNPRHATRTAAAAMLAATLIMLGVVYYAIGLEQIGKTSLIWTMILAGTFAGLAMSLFWPYLMSWVSADFEGITLNRRLGTYNGMWSGAAIIGPLAGGFLVEKSTLGPVLAGAGFLVICFLLLCLAKDHSAGTAAAAKPINLPEFPMDPGLVLRCKWMARIVLFCSWLCLGVSRSQFALLFKEIGYSETQFGILITIFGVCNFLILTGAGRLGFWHFKPWLLLGIPIVLAVPLLLILFGRSFWVFLVAFVIMGLGFGFAYSSHLYYGAYGSRNRSTQMAIHEITLSLGVIVGSGAGGYLSGKLGMYWPYWFALIVLTLGWAVQMVVWSVVKPIESDMADHANRHIALEGH
ncbi:MAG: MFS transporter [Sedimentisphaerales bacterium]|nr:MFS transporter [Sedimentisphaerales bacterium]